MRRRLKPDCKITKSRNARQGGYILITLMLFITLLTIALTAMLPNAIQQIQRDREEEMIHRALGYSRAIQRYYKKFGRYPTRLEELENTNNLRFIRKRYKDPITGKDFKLLHMQDVTLNNGPVLPGASGFVGAQGGGIRQAGPGDLNTPQVTGLPSQNAQPPKADSSDDSAGGSATDASKDSDKPSSSAGPLAAGGPGGLSGTVFGGGPILGVASTSKDTTIREFANKNHYNDWLFIYDPTSDRGGLLNSPWQPNPMGAMQGMQPGMPLNNLPNRGPGTTPQPQPGGSNPNPNPMPPDQ